MPGIRLGRAGVGLYRAFTGSVIPPGFYLEAIPTTDTTGTSGVISQLYTNLTGTLVYSKVSGDARISINASTGAISTSAPIYLTDSASFIAKVLDTVSGTYIEAPITLVGSVPTGSRFLMEDGTSFFLLQDGMSRILLEVA